MLVKSLFIVTLLLALCEGGLVGVNYTYYYQSGYRPPNGWHMQGGAYKVVNKTTISYTNQGCTIGVIRGGVTINQSAIAFTSATGSSWSKQGVCTVYCNYTSFYVFVTHCGGTGHNCIVNTKQLGVLVFGVKNYNDQFIYNRTLGAAGPYANFKAWQCLSNYTSVFLNGNLLYTSNYTEDVKAAGVYAKQVNGLERRVMRDTPVMAYFVNGTVQDVILCDDSPKGRLACQYNTGNFSDGLYPVYEEPVASNFTFVPLDTSSTSYGVLHNFTFNNVTGVAPNQNHIARFNISTISEGYVNFKFNFLNSFTYVESDFDRGSYYGKPGSRCNFRLESINRGLSFNSLTVSIGYGPISGGCKQSVWKNEATCCFAYKYNGGSRNCKGLYTFDSDVNYECVLLVFISKTDGSRIRTATSPPVYSNNNVNINLGLCVDYNVYGITGRGLITNITESVHPGYLDHGGLVLLDATGSIDTFVLHSDNLTSYYKVNPCSDINEQYVVSGGNLVGKLTSNNQTVAQQLGDMFYVKFSTSGRRIRRATSENVISCPYVTYGKFCIKPDGGISNIVPEEVKDYTSLLLNRTDYVLIPNSFNLTVTDEFIQTQFQKIQINCIQYVCGSSIQCKQLFQQYGSVCDSILSIVNGIALQDNAEMLHFYSSTKPRGFDTNSFVNFTAGEFNISLVLPKNGQPTGRSFIEDLLFDKVESLGLPGDSAYQKCTSGPLGFVKDLVCAQNYNGLLVLPPIITAEMQAMYTSSLVASMAFGGITSAGAIPFATQIQARINHLGITQTVLQKNQEKIAASFNKAMKHMQDGFSATSLALQQVQDVVNEQGAILQQTMHSLNKNFGAISHVIQDIYKQLDALEANAQVDRIITGRLSSLSVLASAKQLEYTKVSQQRELAKEKINECVKSQSNRHGFCGEGMHIMSIPQNAPNGIVFLHFTYTPETYANVTAVVGFCVKPGNGTEYGLVPVVGRGIFIEVNGTYYITGRDMYSPRAITAGDVVKLTSCQANYQSINRTVITTFVDEDDFDFDHELSKWWNETSRDFPNLDEFNYTIPVLNISNEIDKIQEVIQGLNDSIIDLETLSILKTYIKWPWYVWLAIFFAIIIFILILGWVFFMTGCCGCCCGCFGIIPLMSKCGKKSSYYTTFDNDVVTEQYRPKKSV
uniref:Spike glycoprotein n=1 Tax=Infectious bronchitis virus TaxID=11120 RepID=E5D089_9GAMC|nr:spike [Infectious bronchitis virus]